LARMLEGEDGVSAACDALEELYAETRKE
jgi:hypothetical protein